MLKTATQRTKRPRGDSVYVRDGGSKQSIHLREFYQWISV
jgi:hypothetical protein